MKKEDIETKRISFEEQKVEDLKAYDEIVNTVNNNITIIRNFDESNYGDLLVDLIDTRQEIIALEKNINSTYDKIDEELTAREQNLSSLKFNINDFINSKHNSIMAIYLAASLAIGLSAISVFDFITKYFLTSVIGLASFDINGKYFTSNIRKKYLTGNIQKLDLNIEIDRHNIDFLKKYLELFRKLLAFELKKLEEIAPRKLPNETDRDFARRALPEWVVIYALEMEENDNHKVKKKTDMRNNIHK